MKTLSERVMRATGVVVLLVLAIAFVLAILTFTLPACPTEDSTFCYWNSAERSNGKGMSFIALWENFTLYNR